MLRAIGVLARWRAEMPAAKRGAGSIRYKYWTRGDLTEEWCCEFDRYFCTEELK